MTSLACDNDFLINYLIPYCAVLDEPLDSFKVVYTEHWTWAFISIKQDR